MATIPLAKIVQDIKTPPNDLALRWSFYGAAVPHALDFLSRLQLSQFPSKFQFFQSNSIASNSAAIHVKMMAPQTIAI